jgi:hypothetical protein
MYTTTRSIASGTLTTCNDCGYAISMNEICEKPLQSATDMRKHIAAHHTSRAFASVVPELRLKPKTLPLGELAPGIA